MKKVILTISSGTSNEKARKENIESVEGRIAENYKDYEVRGAFTSHKILNRLKDKGIFIDNPKEAVIKIAAEGFEELIVQPLHIIPGSEYEKILKVIEEYKKSFTKVAIGKPLLYREEDYVKAIEALRNQIPVLANNQAVALMGHGSSHTAQECYSKLQNFIDAEGLKVYVGTIKGKPGISDVIQRLYKSNIEEVILMPFMLVGGNHAIMDMASEEENSWKSILIKEGFTVDIYLKGLGENIKYQDIYVSKVREAIFEG